MPGNTVKPHVADAFVDLGELGYGHLMIDRPVNTIEIAAHKLRTVHEAAEILRARHS